MNPKSLRCVLPLLALGLAMPTSPSGGGAVGGTLASEVLNRPDLDVFRERLEQAVHRFEVERLERAASDAKPGEVERSSAPRGAGRPRPGLDQALRGHRDERDLRPAEPGRAQRRDPAGERQRIGLARGARTQIQLADSAMGRISGKVTAESNGVAIEDAYVEVYDAAGSYVDATYTDAMGSYSMAGLLGGTYFVAADANGPNLIAELYDNIACPALNCDRTTGTPVAVAESGSVTGIDFALAAGAQISGTVTAEGSGLPIEGSYVEAYDAAGHYAGYAYTDAMGSYSVGGLLGATHFVAADANSQNFIAELYDNIACPVLTCDRTTGTPVVVADADNVAGVDFALAPGAEISGTVTAEATGLPIADNYLEVYDSNGSYAGYAYTDEMGVYKLRGLVGGAYFVATYPDDPPDLIAELFDNIPCPNGSCEVTTGTPVVVAEAGSVTGVDFALAVGAKISGKVTAEDTGLPIEGTTVRVYDASGNSVVSESTDAMGSYTVDGLALGSHFVTASPNGQSFFAELFDNIPCPGGNCDVATGTPVPLAAAEDRKGVDFALARSATISGVVTDQTTAAAIAGIRIEVRDASGTSTIASASTNGDGAYSVSGLDAGTYLVFARPAGKNYIGEWYDDVSCPFFPDWIDCDSNAAKPVVVRDSQTVSGIDFGLAPGSAITGVMTDEVSGAPIPNTYVWLFDEGFWNSGYLLGLAATDSAGRYRIEGLPEGRYFVSTLFAFGLESPRPNYVDEVFDDVPCPRFLCNYSNPLVVAAATTVTGVNLALAPGAKIEGTVTESGTGTPIAGVSVTAFVNGWSIESGSTDADGRYQIIGLPAGRFRVGTSNSKGFIDHRYHDVRCPRGTCPAVLGQPIVLGAGGAVSGIDFDLVAGPPGPIGGSISGRVTDASTGVPLPSVRIHLVNLAGTARLTNFTRTDGTYSRTNLAPGYYRVWADAPGRQIDELYPNVQCPGGSCDFREGQVLTVRDGTVISDIDFALDLGAQIEGTVRGEDDGLPRSGSVVSLYDSRGRFVESGASDPLGRFVTGGVPPGTYFARTEAWLLDSIDELYSDKSCPFGLCETRNGKPIVVGVENAKGVDFTVSRGSRISGRVTAAATGEPILFSLVRIDDASGNLAAYGYTNLNGEYTTHGGISPWRYYPRASGLAGRGWVQQSYPGDGLAINGSRSGIDFTLAGGGTISGTLTDSVTGLPLGGITVEVVAATGEVAARVTSGTLGVYFTPGLPDGSYKVRARGGFDFLGELYPDLPCELRRCDLDGGVAVVIQGANVVAGVDFALDGRPQAALP